MAKEKYQSAQAYEDALRKTLTDLANKTLTPKELLEIKKITHGIHTHITYLMGKKFLESIVSNDDMAQILEEDFIYDEMCNNGFDIELSYNNKKIVAEIKGNIPVCNNKTYGANQRDSITKDIDYLIYGKNKSKGYKPVGGSPLESLKDACRFLILLKDNETAIRTLIENLKNKNEEKYNDLFYFPENLCWEEFPPQTINIIFIDLKM